MPAVVAKKNGQISRFTIMRTLGCGAQGTVYLAEDPHLHRRVAIKTVVVGSQPGGADRDALRTLLDEARIVSRLHHPNIVTLFDAGEDKGVPYLVLEYVDGVPLAEMLMSAERMKVKQAVDIAIQVLDAIEFAHQQQITHRDIKPSNILITDNGTAHVMDFGIAQRFTGQAVAESELTGTPSYMAPEYIHEKVFSTRCDIFSLGMLLHEMLCGRHFARGGNVYETFNRILNSEYPRPSTNNPDVDPQLDQIVMKALDKDPAARFETAGAMAAALRAYLNPDAAPVLSESGRQAAIDFLLRRMRHKSDFPALSQTISAVNRVVRSDKERLNVLANSILKDVALTNKMLRLVNSAYYSQFGGNISTISRAVAILGFDAVRSIAVSIMLFDHLQNKIQAIRLKEEAVSAYLSGMIARELGRRSGIRDVEEASVCAMFHDLGRLLTLFYFHDEMQEIDQLVSSKGLKEAKASVAVLGITFEELGVEIARIWNFPKRILQSMRQIGDQTPGQANTEKEKLRINSALASQLCATLREGDPSERSRRIAELEKRFARALGIPGIRLGDVLDKAACDLAAEATNLGIDPSGSALLRRICMQKKSMQSAGARSVPEREAAASGIDAAVEATIINVAPADSARCAADARRILTSGIQDITNTLVSDYDLNDVLRIILETMYRGLGFSRVLLCMRDLSRNAMMGRIGFGVDVDRWLTRFVIPLTGSKDLFSVALRQGADLFITDINAANIRDHVPEWYRRLVPAQSFLLFPITIDHKVIGLFYADKDAAGTLTITGEELNQLKTLRNQAVLAIRQKQ